MSKKKKALITSAIIFIILALISVTMLFPFFWMLSTSLKDRMHAVIFPPQWIPNPLTTEAYTEVWQVCSLLTGIINSLKIAIPVIIIGTFSSALAAFAFSKMEIPCKGVLFMGLLSTMMIPGAVTMIPQYVTWGSFNLTDSLIPLIVPGLFGNVSMMFFLRQYLNGIPNEFIDAAKIDGAGWMKTFIRIFLPMMKPALAAQIIFWFMGIWNDFMGPLIYLSSESNFTVQLVLTQLNSLSEATSEFPMIMAGSIISMIPLLLLFAIFQKYFVESMAISGIKG